MLECLEQWWNNAVDTRRHDRELELTLIRLMVSMMNSDGQLDMREHDAVIRLLVRRFAISSEAAEHLFQEARQAETESRRYEQLAQQLGSRCSWLDVATLLDDIWCVAEGDGHLDSLDERYVRRICRLLGKTAVSPAKSGGQRKAA